MMQVTECTIHRQKFFSIVAGNEEVAVVKMVNAIGYRRRHNNGTGSTGSIEYLLSENEYKVFKLLWDNGFFVAGCSNGTSVVSRLHKTFTALTIDEAIRKIQNGDYVVENFLDAVDEK